MKPPVPATEAPHCPCAGRCHHDKSPCSLGCWAAQKPWRVEEARAAQQDRIAALEEALRLVTARERCPHGHNDVFHIAPSHFDGPACPQCSDAAYADAIQAADPCAICAALIDVAPARETAEPT